MVMGAVALRAQQSKRWGACGHGHHPAVRMSAVGHTEALEGPPAPALWWALYLYSLARVGASHSAILSAPSAVSSQEHHLPALPGLSRPYVAQPLCRAWQERGGLRAGILPSGRHSAYVHWKENLRQVWAGQATMGLLASISPPTGGGQDEASESKLWKPFQEAPGTQPL